MAIYHFHVKVGHVGGGAEHSDYMSRRGEHAHEHEGEQVETFSGNLPLWADSARAFWSAADQFERKNGSPYREFEGALPRELSPEQNRALLEEFIKQELGDRHVYECAIHFKPGNPHFHLQFCERELDGVARPPEQFFKRYNAKDTMKGGCRKSTRFAGGELSDRKQQRQNLRDVRKAWAGACNRHLEIHGHADRIDHRSFAARGITAVPGKHAGAFATALERAGVHSKRGDQIHEYRENQGRARCPAKASDPADRPGGVIQTPAPSTPTATAAPGSCHAGSSHILGSAANSNLHADDFAVGAAFPPITTTFEGEEVMLNIREVKLEQECEPSSAEPKKQQQQRRAQVVADEKNKRDVYRLSFKKADGEVITYNGAIYHRGKSLITIPGDPSASKAQAAVQAAQDHGWKAVTISGENPEHHFQCAMAFRAAGIHVEGLGESILKRVEAAEAAQKAEAESKQQSLQDRLAALSRPAFEVQKAPDYLAPSAATTAQRPEDDHALKHQL